MKLMLVDDEENILRALTRVFRARCTDLEVRAFSDAREAIKALELEVFDVLVTDMRMPIITGATLLEIATVRWPSMTRVVLSGNMDPTSAETASSLAHEVLSKPCTGDALKDMVDRARARRDGMGTNP